MSVNQAVVRGYNFFVVAVLGILGVGLITELFMESEWLFKVDEFLVIAITVVAVVWYLVGKNRWTLSIVPPLLAALALGAKVLGLFLEIKNADDIGDDIGVIQTLVIFIIVAVVVYISIRRQTRRLSNETAQEVNREMQPIG